MNMKKMKKFFTLSRRAEGFTLVELIVVIAILAILGGVAVPAYSGYVKKAERSADEALLKEINTAFASACSINGMNYYGRNDTDIMLTDDKKVSAVTVAADVGFNDTFMGFFSSTETQFKVMEALLYSPQKGGFIETTSKAKNLYNALKENPELLEKLKNSALGDLGAETILTEVGNVLDWGVADLGLRGGSAFEAFYYELLGFDPNAYDTDEERQAAYEEAVAQYGDESAVYANAMALYAAEKSSGVTLSGVSSWLGKNEDDFQADSSGNALGEAAAIYALYMSFKGEEYNADSANAGNIFADALKDEEFKAWVMDENSTAQAELEAFQASMELASDDTTQATVLENGFDDPEMIEVLGSLLGN